MSRSIQILALASEDADGIFRWLCGRSIRGAVTWYLTLKAKIATIAKHPEQYSIIAESRPKWGRTICQAFFKTPRGRLYRIVFEWNDAEVIVLRVRRPGQKPLKMKDIPGLT